MKLTELVKLFLGIEVLNSVEVGQLLNEGVVLLQESAPVQEVTSSEANAESLAGVGGANTSLCGANSILTLLLF